jgi:hypothetical protein
MSDFFTLCVLLLNQLITNMLAIDLIPPAKNASDFSTLCVLLLNKLITNLLAIDLSPPAKNASDIFTLLCANPPGQLDAIDSS